MAGAKFTLVQDENVNLVINQGATINFSIEWTNLTVKRHARGYGNYNN